MGTPLYEQDPRFVGGAKPPMDRNAVKIAVVICVTLVVLAVVCCGGLLGVMRLAPPAVPVAPVAPVYPTPYPHPSTSPNPS